ncbi:MAG: SDR family oxidoreductase [Ardenticatenales bacterium]
MGDVRMDVTAATGPARPLAGRVAVVAGATRGAGRGIARMLGEAGATVYCTGRSTRAGLALSAVRDGRAETIEETAALVDAAGGRGIAVRVDHGVEAEVIALFERVKADHGRLDVLVNDIWGGDPLTEWGTPFWRLDLDKGRRLLDTAVWTHVITARHGAPLMVERGHGLIVEVTDGDFTGYRGTLFYDLAKLATIRLAYDMAQDLAGTGVTALCVTPGFLRSEAVLDHFGVAESNWRDAVAADPFFAFSETPNFVGRAVAALAADAGVGARSGGLYASWTLAKEYGFDDVDGRRPDWGRDFKAAIGVVVDRPGALEAGERELLQVRLWQVERDAGAVEEAGRLRERLQREGVAVVG